MGYALALSGQIAEGFAPLQHTVGQTPFAHLTSRPALTALCVAWASEVYLHAGRVAEVNDLAVQVLACARERKERGTEAWTL